LERWGDQFFDRSGWGTLLSGGSGYFVTLLLPVEGSQVVLLIRGQEASSDSFPIMSAGRVLY
jgi:hypothetical protein